MISRRRSLPLLSMTAAVMVADLAHAQDRLRATVLQLTTVSLDAKSWTLDEEKVDPAGDRFFYADHATLPNVSVDASEVKTGARVTSRQMLATQFLRGVKQRAKYFAERPCPDAFAPAETWVCAAYEATILTSTPGQKTVVHITVKDGTIIYKKAKFPITAQPEQIDAARVAFLSITLKP